MTIQGHGGAKEDRTLTWATKDWEVQQEVQRDLRLGGRKGWDYGEEKIVEQ